MKKIEHTHTPYIKQVLGWNKKNWGIFFAQYPDFSLKDKHKIMRILSFKRKKCIENHFPYLASMGIINGIGPGYLGKFFRAVITFFCYGVESRWHDIMYAIGGNFLDRIKADWNLLKYSIIGIGKIYKNIYFFEINPISKLLIFVIFSIIGMPLQIVISVFCFLMVLLFGGFGSFNYHKK